MSEFFFEQLAPRVKAWGQAEIRRQNLHWTSEFLRLKARVAHCERRAGRIQCIERLAWLAAAAASLLSLALTWPGPGWAGAEWAPFLLLPPLASFLLLARSAWVLLKA